MRGKRLFALYGTICLALILASLPLVAACEEEVTPPPAEEEEVTSPAPEAPEVIELSFASFSVAGSEAAEQRARWGSELEKRTGGRVKVTFYWGNTLCKTSESLRAVKTGMADIVSFPMPSFPEDFPITDLVNLPFILPNQPATRSWLMEMYYRGLLKEYDPYKVILWTSFTPAHLILVDKKVTSLEDFRGVKIRALGHTVTEMVTLLGATPVSMDMAEVYMGLERGVIDGVTGPMNIYTIMKLHEVCKYVLDEPLYSGLALALMDRGRWDELPIDIQLIINETSLWYMSLIEAWHLEPQGMVPMAWTKAREVGEVYSLTAEERARWHRVTAPLVDNWVADRNAKGLPGTEALEIANSVMERHGLR